jgi:hypothetical protein
MKVHSDNPDLLRRTYQFLAPRFMMVKEWVLMTKLKAPDTGGDGFSQLGSVSLKPPKSGGVMRW